jgi:hypothetical protein
MPQFSFALVLLPGLLWVGMGCAREPRYKSPKMGEVVTIKPIAINLQLVQPPHKTQALKLNVMWGGRMLTSEKGDTTLNFYDKNGKLRRTVNWAELETAYQTTGCDNEAIATLDGSLMGTALICDDSLDLKEITMIEGVDSKGEKRFSTSWSVYMLDDEVAAASIGLY